MSDNALLDINFVLRKAGQLVHGDSFDTPAPRFTDVKDAMRAIEDKMAKVRREGFTPPPKRDP